MTFEQKVQLWMVVGTWVAGLATLAAVMTSLYFARSAENGHKLVQRARPSPGYTADGTGCR